MNRKEFGQLIASLRNDLNWTQSLLAEYAEIDIATLSNIERGAKRHLDPEILVNLANALQLTSLERREFFLGASGVPQEKIVRQPGPNTPTQVFNPELVLGNLLGVMGKIQLPLTLGDPFGETIAVNRAMLEVIQVDPASLKTLTRVTGGFSVLHFVYGMLQGQQTFGQEFNEAAISAIRSFREGSLRYRSDPRYSELMNEFRNVQKYPLFDRYWRKASTLDMDKEAMRELLEFQHPFLGKLRFFLCSAVTLTPYGELYLTHYMPHDRQTNQSLIEIFDKGGSEVVQLLSWPDKKPLP